MAMILVTHDLGVVAGRTDEIAVMYAGRIVEKGPTRQLFVNMRHPYTAALLSSIPRIEQPEPDAPARHPRSPAQRDRSVAGVPVRRPLSARPTALPHRGPTARGRARRRPPVRLLLPGRHPRGRPSVGHQPRQGHTAAGLDLTKPDIEAA